MHQILLRVSTLLVSLPVLLAPPPASAGTIIHVSNAGNDAANGLTWAMAKRNIQTALNAAVSGDQVWVAQGTYHERMTLKEGVQLYGGYAGVADTRDVKTYVTTLDGDQAGSVVTCPPGITGATRIDGFSITNGSAAGTSSNPGGGGVCCLSSSPTITNNTIAGNAGPSGGGVHLSSFTGTVANNTIAENSASNGGAIYCRDCTSSAVIAGNTIVANSVSRNGGGIYAYSSVPTITNNTIAGNSAVDGGAVHCNYASAVLSNNIIAFNSSGLYGTPIPPIPGRNCVYGNADYNYKSWTSVPGDISVDPEFAGREFGNYHLQPGSPCIDGGRTDAVGVPSTDIDGQSRIQGQTVDIGADESDGTAWPAGPNVVIRVSPNGDDTNDGSSWELAKRTVQAGIDAASALGGEVWLMKGIYSERATLHAYAHLYGGFAGIETSRSERDWAENVTVLDGGAAGSVITTRFGHGISTIDGLTIRNGSSGGILCWNSGPMITNNAIVGNAGSGIKCSNSSAEIVGNKIIGNTAGEGGGVYCSRSKPMIANNSIVANSATSYGGGVYSWDKSPTITNNTIVGNNADGGGGLYFSGGGPRVWNNIVAFNSSGIRRDQSALTLINNCVFGNRAYDYFGEIWHPLDISVGPRLAGMEYGDIHIQPGSPCIDAGENDVACLSLTDMDGQPRIQGGGIDIGADESDGRFRSIRPDIIVMVSPSGHDANSGTSWKYPKRTVQAGIDAASVLNGEVWVAAGLYVERITLRPFVHVYGGFRGMEKSRSARDWAANKTILDGGASGPVVTAKVGHQVSTVDGFTIRNGSGGGVYCYAAGPIVSCNTITGNIAQSGGGIRCWVSSPTIRNNLITRNTSTGGGIYSGGGGIYCDGSSAAIVNNTIVGNTATEGYFRGGGGIYCGNSDPHIAYNVVAFNSSGIGRGDTRVPCLRNNCVYGNTTYDYSYLPPGEGDLSADPLLVDLASGDYHLTALSPCRDKGSNIISDSRFDLDGQGRVFKRVIDIGADEYWPPDFRSTPSHAGD